jgi:two-component system copper resistance phosphate regulon response regulator CusR
MRALIVEDERKVAGALEEALQSERFEVIVEHSGIDASNRLQTETFDVILLDLTLPGCDGLQLVSALRARHVDTPVLILSARDRLNDRVSGLDSGADDYLIKPFAVEEVLARTRALVRRGAAADALPLQTVGDLVVDRLTRQVARAGQSVELTVREFDLLGYLMQHRGRVVSRDALARDLWNESTRTTYLNNVIDVHMARLRRKLDTNGSCELIHTVRGVGFILGEEEHLVSR